MQLPDENKDQNPAAGAVIGEGAVDRDTVKGKAADQSPAAGAALAGMLAALAIVLGYLESLLPPFFMLPGMKIGLTNIVVLFALYYLGWGYALGINLIRILAVGMLFGSGISIIYSLAGGALSFIIMLLLKKSGAFRLVTVSIAGGIAHNLGQLLAAAFFVKSISLLWYMALLWFSGIGAGALVGSIAALLFKGLKRKKCS